MADEDTSMRARINAAQKLNEVEVIAGLAFNPTVTEITQGSKPSAKIGKHEVEVKDFPHHNQELYVIRDDKDAVVCYGVVQNNSGHWFLMELATANHTRKQGMASAVLKCVISLKTKVFLDREMSAESIALIERLIAANAVNASVVDYASGTITAYNPATDGGIPMYDKRIPGNSRPLLQPADAQKFGWLLETRHRRGGLLQEYIRYL